MIAIFSRPPFSAPRALALLLALLLGQTVCADGRDLLRQGQEAFDSGAFSRAAAAWEKALESCKREGNRQQQVAAALCLARAYQNLGQQRRAVDLLEDAVLQAQNSGAPLQMIEAKAKLGVGLILIRQLDRANLLLTEALEQARAAGISKLVASILNDQGSALQAEQKYLPALSAYEEGARLARQTGSTQLLAQVLVNAAATATRAGQFAKANGLNAEALAEIQRLHPDHQTAFLLLTAAQTDRQTELNGSEASTRLLKRAHQSLSRALEIGESTEDLSVQTYALGYLGQVYEQDGQPEAALALTRSATFAAQQAQIPEALYRWQWQLGRLLKNQRDFEAALAAYRRAKETLRPIRQDVSSGFGNGVSRLTFREAEGPLFFELADLLLRQVDAAANPARVQELLVEARDTVEQLKAVELEDYFCDDCVDIQRTKIRAIEAVEDHTAVIYLIPLSDRTELLVGLNAGLHRFVLEVGTSALTAEVRQFRKHLETRTTYEYLDEAQQLYRWLIQPIRELLRQNQVDTLVIVPDGALRTIPFAALHDGQRFLIQDFAVAVAPGLSLVDPRPIQKDKMRLLLNGLSRPVQGFPPLYFVPGELQGIAALRQSDTLLDETFTLDSLKRRLEEEQYSVVHIASHGQFGREVRNTFVLTFDSKLTLNDLEAAIRPSQYRGRPVELLTLSACQTAAGDDRAALGLAGVAVKAGARSALATLWFVNDQSTSALVEEMYGQLLRSSTLSKAHALQRAQLKLLADRRYRHPCYWSPYLLIGNWL